MLPSLPQYMIALLKILLAAAPTSKAKTDSINIMTDVLPEEMPMTVMQSMKLGRRTLLLGILCILNVFGFVTCIISLAHQRMRWVFHRVWYQP